MAAITLKGKLINTVGELPAVGSPAPEFALTNGELGEVGLDKFSGKKKILNIVPSLDTGTCAASAKRFDGEVAALDDTVVLNISADLPFAQGRFCSSEGTGHIVPLSSFRSRTFGSDYGVEFTDGPLRGLLSRAIVVLDANNNVVHTEQVPETVDEPNYDAALAAAKGA
jgi:thiol peroxidase